jgi:hypothetical protein
MFSRQRENTAIMEETFSVCSVPRCYNQDKLAVAVSSRVEAASNTSAVALRVLGGDEKGSRIWGCNWARVPWGYKYGNQAFQVGGVANLRQ